MWGIVEPQSAGARDGFEARCALRGTPRLKVIVHFPENVGSDSTGRLRRTLPAGFGSGPRGSPTRAADGRGRTFTHRLAPDNAEIPVSLANSSQRRCLHRSTRCARIKRHWPAGHHHCGPSRSTRHMKSEQASPRHRPTARQLPFLRCSRTACRYASSIPSSISEKP